MITIIILSIIVLIQLVLLLGCTVKIVDANATINQLVDHSQCIEESRCRMQSLVHNKFNYRVPMSDKYLSLEELKLEKGVGSE